MIDKRIREILCEQLGLSLEEVTFDSNLISDLGADELDTIEIVMALEEEFGIEIDDEEAEDLTTVRKLIDYVEGKKK